MGKVLRGTKCGDKLLHTNFCANKPQCNLRLSHPHCVSANEPYYILPRILSVFPQCKLEFQACSSSKSISVKCEGPCPCLPSQEVIKAHNEKNGKSFPVGLDRDKICRNDIQNGDQGFVYTVYKSDLFFRSDLETGLFALLFRP